MSAPASPAALRLADANQHLHQELHRLEISSQPSAVPPDLGGLLAALDTYVGAVLACLPLVTTWQDNPHPSPAELLTEREADPMYKLGWLRGYRQGQAAEQRPAHIDPETMMQRVRHLVAQMHERYSYGSVPLGALNSR